jgi:peroxiredoxin
MHRATSELLESGIMDRILKPGEKAPKFSLPNANGKMVNSKDLLAKGNLVIIFYRGAW